MRFEARELAEAFRMADQRGNAAQGTPALSSSSSSPSVGQYWIEGKIGSGNFGEVFVGRDKTTGEKVRLR